MDIDAIIAKHINEGSTLSRRALDPEGYEAKLKAQSDEAGKMMDDILKVLKSKIDSDAKVARAEKLLAQFAARKKS